MWLLARRVMQSNSPIFNRLRCGIAVATYFRCVGVGNEI